MDTATLIEKTTALCEARPGYHYSHQVLKETIETGLQDGDIISKGKTDRVVVNGDTIEGQKRDVGGNWGVTHSTPLSEGHDNLLMIKAYMACQQAHSMGRIA